MKTHSTELVSKSTLAVRNSTFTRSFSKHALAGVFSMALALGACGTEASKSASQGDSQVNNLPYQPGGRIPNGTDPNWIYNGLLPTLENPSIVASLKAHTVRVTGLLPDGYDKPLPYYAIVENDKGRIRVSVVYPIATGDLSDFNEGGAPVRNGPGRYPDIFAYPYNRYAVFGKPVEWGGFPFLEYNHARSLAFHGPITHGDEWQLMRGPVSHGCNRMQGEHVVELAHLIGVNMLKTWTDFNMVRRPVTVDVLSEYDTWNGQNVDVDYPAMGSVKRPNTNVRMFPTWDARDYPRFVCEYKSGRILDGQHCDYKTEQKTDPLTAGKTRGIIGCPEGYTLQDVGTGKICTDGTNAWGPFTRAMTARCLAWGGGDEACASDRWAEKLAMSARGNDVCPFGSSFDVQTGYCVEGNDAFGPFPANLVSTCTTLGGGQSCAKARWDRNFLRYVIKTQAQ